MKINNINELKKSINYSTILVFFVIFSVVLVALYLTHSKFVQKTTLLDRQEIISAGNLYKSNLSEKLSIIASSTVFLDYLRSGDVTRERLYSQFLSQLSSLKSKSISGMQLIDLNGKILFDYGSQTPFYISLKLCYLNQTLDPEMGDCNFSWKLYLRKLDLLNEILAINKSIKICNNCDSYNLVDSDFFGSFPIKSNALFKFMLSIDNENDYFFYVYFILLSASLAVFGIWSWFRLSGLLNNYIANPIKNLTTCLKDNNSLDLTNNIDEIQFLINEINSWKSKLNKIQADENAAIIGKIAAQLAHDVRSPLSAIDMLVKNITNVPENYRTTLRNATQRISDIANNFLTQYKRPHFAFIESNSMNEHIPTILENMISEKRSQYIDKNVEIQLCIAEDAWDIFSFIHAVDFKRAMSNLINNSIEAITGYGRVVITLNKLQDSLRIDIVDNGCGISSELLPIISAGGVSIGKKNGSGLGLSHATAKITEWGGSLAIKSKVGTGTEVSIILLLSPEIPLWFKSDLSLPDRSMVCILDDESQTHDLWKARFNQVKTLYLSTQHFFDPIDIGKFVSNNHHLDVIYLIDYDLGHVFFNGLDIIEKYNIKDKATLVTNRYDDPEIQKRCTMLNVKIIPKNLILHIPIGFVAG